MWRKMTYTPHAVYRAYNRQEKEKKKTLSALNGDGDIKEYYDKRWLRILSVIWIRTFVNNKFIQ